MIDDYTTKNSDPDVIS